MLPSLSRVMAIPMVHADKFVTFLSVETWCSKRGSRDAMPGMDITSFFYFFIFFCCCMLVYRPFTILLLWWELPTGTQQKKQLSEPSDHFWDNYFVSYNCTTVPAKPGLAHLGWPIGKHGFLCVLQNEYHCIAGRYMLFTRALFVILVFIQSCLLDRCRRCAKNWAQLSGRFIPHCSAHREPFLACGSDFRPWEPLDVLVRCQTPCHWVLTLGWHRSHNAALIWAASAVCYESVCRLNLLDGHTG